MTSWGSLERARIVPELDLAYPVTPGWLDLRRPYAEVVDAFDAAHGTNVRADLEAAGVPLIAWEGSAMQAQGRRFLADQRTEAA